MKSEHLPGCSSTGTQALQEGHINIFDVESHMRKKTTMAFQLCPVDGHNFHGLVESTINSIQSAFKRMNLSSHWLHATGLQTVLMLVQNDPQLNTVCVHIRSYSKQLTNAHAHIAEFAIGLPHQHTHFIQTLSSANRTW